MWTTDRGADGHGLIKLLHVVISLRYPNCTRAALPALFPFNPSRLFFFLCRDFNTNIFLLQTECTSRLWHHPIIAALTGLTSNTAAGTWLATRKPPHAKNAASVNLQRLESLQVMIISFGTAIPFHIFSTNLELWSYANTRLTRTDIWPKTTALTT